MGEAAATGYGWTVVVPSGATRLSVEFRGSGGCGPRPDDRDRSAPA